jgi:threonine dehydratase
MHEKWNITLFHYRNHGGDFGRVLVGFDVPQSDMVLFQSFLEGVGYPYWDETKNEAINLFLRP